MFLFCIIPLTFSPMCDTNYGSCTTWFPTTKLNQGWTNNASKQSINVSNIRLVGEQIILHLAPPIIFHLATLCFSLPTTWKLDCFEKRKKWVLLDVFLLLPVFYVEANELFMKNLTKGIKFQVWHKQKTRSLPRGEFFIRETGCRFKIII